MTREAAWTSCLGEAVERYSGGCWQSDEAVICKRGELSGESLDPRRLVLFLPDQYEGLEYAPYHDDTVLRWVRARSLTRDVDIWVPALAIFMEYQVHHPQEFLFPVTSNGLAAGPSLGDAVLSALYEVLERDALLIAWLQRLPARRLDAVLHPDAHVRQLARAYESRGVELALYSLPSDHPCEVVLGIAYQRGGHGGPFATIGLGADLDLEKAARSAALEVGQVRPAFRERCRTHDAARIAELVEDPQRVETLEDHALVYADQSMKGAFEFLEGGTRDWPPRDHDGPLPHQSDPQENGQRTAAHLQHLLDHFAARDQDVLYVNLTPRDLEPMGLFTARVLVPGFQPIWFGRGQRRLAGERLYSLPRALGLKEGAGRSDQLNPLPHPIA